MTSTRDVHDMLGIDADATSRPLKSRKKSKVPGVKRPDGMAREVFSLLGERAPPIPIAEPTSQFKAKRKTGKEEAARWSWFPFEVTQRADKLVLRHWRREIVKPLPGNEQGPGTPKAEDQVSQAVGEEMSDLDQNVLQSRDRSTMRMERNAKQRAAEQDQTPIDEEYRFAKYNVKTEEPSYDDELYETHLSGSDWTKEETDYLMSLHEECWGKWHVIADRFDFQSKDSDSAEPEEPSPPKDRSLDALKSRYYTVGAKVMSAKTPLFNMNDKEFAAHEKMNKFSAEHERERKMKKEALLTRSKNEAEEERLLVAELERMYKRQTEQEAELKDLRDRLDFSLSADLPNANYYTTSAEIGGLLQKLFTKDKAARQMQQRRLQEAGLASSPAGPSTGAAGGSMQGNKRASIVSTTPARQHMSSESEQRFGVKALDKTVSGVTFKSDKLLKARQLKSAAKSQALAVILSELGIPDIIVMPTDEVGRGLETLVGKVGLLIDRRNNVGKEQNDWRVEREKRAMDGGGTSSGSVQPDDVGAAVQEEQEDEEDADGDAEGDADADADEDEDEDEDGDAEADDDNDVDMTEINDAAGDRDDDEVEDSTEVKEEPTETDRQEADAATSRGNKGNKRSASALSASSAGSVNSRAASKRRRG